MDTIFMNSENNKNSDPHRLKLNLSDKIILRRSDKYVDLSNLSMYYTWKNIKNSCKNNKYKTSALTWNEEFEWPDEPYSTLWYYDIQDYFECILKKYEKFTDDPSVIICVNKIKLDNKILSWIFNAWNNEITWRHLKEDN